MSSSRDNGLILLWLLKQGGLFRATRSDIVLVQQIKRFQGNASYFCTSFQSGHASVSCADQSLLHVASEYIRSWERICSLSICYAMVFLRLGKDVLQFLALKLCTYQPMFAYCRLMPHILTARAQVTPSVTIYRQVYCSSSGFFRRHQFQWDLWWIEQHYRQVFLGIVRIFPVSINSISVPYCYTHTPPTLHTRTNWECR